MVTRAPAKKPSDIDTLEKYKWMIGIIAGFALNIGMGWQQFQQLQKQFEENRATQGVLVAKITEFREKQIGGLQDIEVLKSNVKNIDSRVLVIERIFIERPQSSTPAGGFKR